MPGHEDSDDAVRLEAALDRIARAASRAAARPALRETTLREAREQTTSAPPRTQEVAARLDGVIAALRGVLGTEV
jgi:hypothetical protein